MTKNDFENFQNVLKMKSYSVNGPWRAKNYLIKFFSYEVKILSLLSKSKWKMGKNQIFAT